MKKQRPRTRGKRSGQTAVEYMLVISVLAVALWAAAQLVVPQWKDGLQDMTGDVQNMAAQGYVGGS